MMCGVGIELALASEGSVNHATGAAMEALDRLDVLVNIASTHRIVAWPFRKVCGTAKGSMIQMSRILAIEWADKNFRVNTVSSATVMAESRMARVNMLARIPSIKYLAPKFGYRHIKI
ncbi:MAG: SDR family oxidoreductase [Betaproteobacteria bacterium]|jgi:NAD(P)-dependent dehydrogenase (short-subunit alcohol dehydrogenase family)|nr:SDR family oxidoreductase [Betaproteobacteria bacterium]